MPEMTQLHADSEQTTYSQYYVASPSQLSNNPFVTPPDALFYRQICVEYCQELFHIIPAAYSTPPAVK